MYVGLFAVSAAMLGGATFLEVRSAVQQQITARIETEMAFLDAEFRAGGLERLVAAVRARGRGAGALDYLVQDAAGRPLAGEMPSIVAPRPGWTTIDVAGAREEDGRPERVRALAADLGAGLVLAVGDDQGRITEIEEAVATAFAWTVGLVALLGIGGGIVLSRAFLARVDAIAGTAEAIIEGDLSRRMPVNGTDDDLDRLARTLNRMLDRIAALMDSLRQVGSDVAHDLRTPLSRLFQRLEDARAHAATVGQFEIAVDAALHEAEGLLQTFTALLRIAQVEGSPRAGFAAVDLSAMLDSVIDAYRPDAEEAGHRLSVDVGPGIVLRGDRELLTQAAANLVENALRHTPPGTTIGITLQRGPGQAVRLTVRDDGPGVVDADVPHLVNRFYRGERSRTTPGNGLGLSLVAAVADLHGATLSIRNAHPGLVADFVFNTPGTAATPAR